MERDQFLHKVSSLRTQGKSVRGIASELGVNRGRVDRALKRLARVPPDKPTAIFPPTESSDGLTEDVFVGRESELGELKAMLEDALLGHGRLVMLVGEPGIGKTRTAQELAAIARQRGAHTLWGRCYEEQGAPPYWPWVQIVRSYVNTRSAEQLLSDMGAGAAVIAEMVPDVRGKLPDPLTGSGQAVKPPPRLDSPESNRFRLFDSITRFLRNTSQIQPLLLILDDLHWADMPSLLLLEFLAYDIASSHLLVLGTYRDIEVSRGHPLSKTLAQLAREHAFGRIPLYGLGQEDVGQLIESICGVTPPEELAQAIHGQTEGNPFFMTEVIRYLAHEGKLTSEQLEERKVLRHGSGPALATRSRQTQRSQKGRAWNVEIPQSVRDVIGRRLDRLSGSCNQALTLASVIGHEFDMCQLAPVMEAVSEAQLLELLEEALDAHIIEEANGSPERFRFSHMLIRQTLLGRLSAARRVRLDARIATALEELYGPEASDHAAALARHFAEAEPVLGPEKLIKYSHIAGEKALGNYAYEEALAHFEQALAAKKQGLMDNTTAELLFGLARAQVGAAERLQLAKAQDTFIQAFDFFVAVGNKQRAIEVAAYPLYTTNDDTRELIERALDLAPAGSHDAGKLLFRYGWMLGGDLGDDEKAMDALGEALIIAQNQQDRLLEMKTLVAAGHVDAVNLRYNDCLEKNLRAIELAQEVNEPVEESRCHYELAQVLYCMGDLERATKHAEAMLRPAERSGHRSRLSNAHQIQGTVYALRGDWKGARLCFERGLQVSPRDGVLLEELAILEFQQGNFQQGQEYIRQFLDVFSQSERSSVQRVYQTIIAMLSILSKLTGENMYLDKAEALAVGILSESSRNPQQHTGARMALGLAAIQSRDVELAREQYSSLTSLSGLTHRWGQGFSFDRLLGLLAQTMGSFDQAQTHFEHALAFCRRAGYRPELAWTCYDYANLLHQRGQRLKALALFEEAIAISAALGMKPLMEKLTALKAQLEAHPMNAHQYPNSLTEREVEVLRLVALGRSNAEIAEKLVLSIRTVERHISNMYSKTNTRGRAEATAFAFTHGLIPSNRTT